MESPEEEEVPHLCCSVCMACLSCDNYPVQSLVCGHSICITCVSKATTTTTTTTTSTTTTAANSNPKPAGAGQTSDHHQYLDCPICKEPKAFHLTLSKPNFMALGAIDLINQCMQIIHDKTGSNSIRALAGGSSNVKDISSTGKASNNFRFIDNPQTTKATVVDGHVNKEKEKTANSEKQGCDDVSTLRTQDKALSPAGKYTIEKTVSFQESPHCTSSSAESESSEDTLEPASPPGDPHPSIGSGGGERGRGGHRERMVWVKFGKDTHLAMLLETKKDTAIVRWESNKYKEKVSLDRIEEMDDCSNSMSRSKRSRRRVNTFSSSQVLSTSSSFPKKKGSTKRRKSHT